MLDEKEIEMEIARLEYVESSYPNYAKLANLYTIRDQMQKGKELAPSLASSPDLSQAYSRASHEPVYPSTANAEGESDFLRAVRGKDSREVWKLVNELMFTLQILNKRVYNWMMEKVEGL